MARLRNKFERKVHGQLKRAKVLFGYECERIPYTKYYVPDFVIETEHGKIYVETKGYLRPTDKAKLTAVKKQNPTLDIRIVFYEKRKSNIKWAEKNKFIYAFEKIPRDWLT